jgi:hypothetical protein
LLLPGGKGSKDDTSDDNDDVQRRRQAVTRMATARSAHRSAPPRSSETIILFHLAVEMRKTASASLLLPNGKWSKDDISDDNDDVKRVRRVGHDEGGYGPIGPPQCTVAVF